MHLLKLYFLVVTFNKCNFFAQKKLRSFSPQHNLFNYIFYLKFSYFVIILRYNFFLHQHVFGLQVVIACKYLQTHKSKILCNG